MVTVLLIIIYTDTIWDEWKKKKGRNWSSWIIFIDIYIIYVNS